MSLITVGAGDFGTPLIDIASRSGNEVVVIESDDKRAGQAADRFDCLGLDADATTKDTVADAGPDTALPSFRRPIRARRTAWSVSVPGNSSFFDSLSED